MEILRAENLVKTFPVCKKQRKALHITKDRKTVVNDISFTARSGEVFGLLGPNGAGKTTTMRILTTLIKPDGGDVFYNDKSVVKNQEAVRSEFAFLTADLKLDIKSTADEMFDFFAQLYHIPVEIAKRRKADLFDGFGITTFADTKICRLSQGMRQKVSLVCSVIHDPKFIIFDDPTIGLDLIAVKDVGDFILKMKTEGKCIVVSTHIFDFAERICDRAAIVIDGEIVKNDTLVNIMNGQSLGDAFYHIYTERKGEHYNV